MKMKKANKLFLCLAIGLAIAFTGCASSSGTSVTEPSSPMQSTSDSVTGGETQKANWEDFNGVWKSGNNPVFSFNNEQFDITPLGSDIINCIIQSWKEHDTFSSLVLNPQGERPTTGYIYGYTISFAPIGREGVMMYTFVFHEGKRYMIFMPTNDPETVIIYTKSDE
jgi:hypothetical protein